MINFDHAGSEDLDQGAVIVADFGKSVSKLTLWSRDGRMLDRQTRDNAACAIDGLRRLDTDGIGTWLTEALGRYRGHPVQAVIPVGHGAGIAAIIDDRLAFAPLDYEQPIPAEIMAAYRAERDPFSVTGSPALPDGLNLGSQLYWLERLYPEAMAQATLLPWAQYWTWFLSGTARSEITSLACHTDIWSPGEGRFSPMAKRLGWAARFAPLSPAADPAGRLRPQIAEATGLGSEIEVLTGIHDSNAALLSARGFEEILRKEATILSTGTWFIAMRLPDGVVSTSTLSERRDCLINVDAYGWRVPSARFMGGREIEIVIEIDENRIDIPADQTAITSSAARVVEAGAMLLPTLAPGCGPFPHGDGHWINRPADMLERRAAMALYAALVTDVSLDLIGSRARLVIEGRFAACELFVRALATLRPETVVYVASAENDVSFGALRLFDTSLVPAGKLEKAQPLHLDLNAYRAAWRAEIGE